MNIDMNEYLMETIARERQAEARASAARRALVRRIRAGRIRHSIGVAFIRVGIRLLARWDQRFGGSGVDVRGAVGRTAV